MEHSYNKPKIPGKTVCSKQEFVISEQFPMRLCSTWLRVLLCYIKKFVVEEFVIRVFHCNCSGHLSYRMELNNNMNTLALTMQCSNSPAGVALLEITRQKGLPQLPG